MLHQVLFYKISKMHNFSLKNDVFSLKRNIFATSWTYAPRQTPTGAPPLDSTGHFRAQLLAIAPLKLTSSCIRSCVSSSEFGADGVNSRPGFMLHSVT